MSFDELDLDDRVILGIKKFNFEEPTKIQKATIPLILEKRDVLGIAPTGSGKTLAYLIPTLNWIYNAKLNHDHPSILILVPTRELVKQVDLVLKELLIGIEINVVNIFAGPREGKQIRAIKNQNFIDIVIATPGRLLKFVEKDIINLSLVSMLVKDEVDTILDLGFIVDILDLMRYLPIKNKRQTLIYGATISKEIEGIIGELMNNPQEINIDDGRMPSEIIHEAYKLNLADKYDVLRKLLLSEEIEKVIIFTQSKHETRITARNLKRDGLELEEIHGGLTQRQRSKAMDNFRLNYVNCLVASDLVSRGLDIGGVSHIINYDVPNDIETYLHRSGRTGRAGNKGKSWLLVSPKEEKNLKNLKEKLNLNIENIMMYNFDKENNMN